MYNTFLHVATSCKAIRKFPCCNKDHFEIARMPMLFVSPYMEKFERNVDQSRAKRLVSRHSPPRTSQRMK